MKITVLDMDTAAIDGDVSLGALEELGEVKIFGKTGREDTAELIGDADAVICNKTRMTREVMQSCPNLRYVGLMGTGFDQVDIKAADELGITFGMKVLFFTRSPAKARNLSGIPCVTLEKLLSESDIVSIHCPLNEGSRELINRRTLSLMKPSALLVNTSRGGIINERDLAQALNNGIIAAAAVDVLTEEPMTENTPLRTAKNIVFTPHVAWAPVETRRRLFEIVAANLRAYREGNPQNTVHCDR